MINISVMVTTEGDYRGLGSRASNAGTKGGATSMLNCAGAVTNDAVTSGAVTSGADTTGAGTTRGVVTSDDAEMLPSTLLVEAQPGALSKPSMVRCRLAAWQTNEQT
jgi:hypothetical protein